jgi:hypothetical protein
MAPVLLCPECGTKHPLDGVNGSAFACRGCGRTLKVPQQVPAAVGHGSAAVPAASDPSSTRVVSTSPRMPDGSAGRPAAPAPDAAAPPRRRAGSIDPVPGRWVRFLLWIIAIPLGFLIVFEVAKAIGVLTTNQIEDVALTEGYARFVPIARLLPFVALVTAGLVHGGVYGITRLRARRHAAALGTSARTEP